MHGPTTPAQSREYGVMLATQKLSVWRRICWAVTRFLLNAEKGSQRVKAAAAVPQR